MENDRDIERQTDRSVKVRSRAKKGNNVLSVFFGGRYLLIRGVEETYEYGTGKTKLGSVVSFDLSHVAPPALQKQLN